MADFLDEFIAGNPAKQSRRKKSGTPAPDNSRIQAIHDGANALGIDPLDYATVISYESAGTFDPWKAGPTTKWGQHRGTIQYGEPQRREFGVYKGQTFEDQVTTSNVNYLKKAGVKPGADLLTIYKAINGGSVKASAKASDGYGTIGGHVQKMMGAHRTKAAKFLGNSYNSQNSTGNNALDSFINQSANNAPANIDDFINAPVGGEAAPMLGAAPEQTVDSVSPLYPAPTSQAAPKPVPESDFTIGEQIQSALKPDSPRAAVLLTEDNQINAVTPENRNLFTPVRTSNGTLVVSNEKASRLGLNTPEDISAHVAKNGFASLIGHVEDVGNNTGEGMAVQTKAPDGSELVTSVVTTPEVATEQLLNHQKQFGGKIGKQEILPVAEAVQAREAADIANLGKANVGATNFGAEPAPEKMPADYFEYLKAREAVDSPELRNEYVSMKQSNPTAYNQTLDVQASVPPARTYPRREIKPNESYYQFEKDGKTESGDEYLGMLNGKHRFQNADGDELELDETNKQLKPVGTAKRAFDSGKNEYILSDDQSNLKQGEVRRAGKDGVNYIFQPDNKIREENPKLVLGEGEQQITQSDSQENVPQGKVRVADKTGKTFFASKAEDGKYSLTEEVERPKATEEDYKTWFDYQKKFVDKSIVDSPETRVRFETSLAEADKTNFGTDASATKVLYSNPKTSSGRVNNLASQPKGEIAGVPAQTASNPSLQSPTTFAPGSYDNIQREIFGTIQPSKIYREKPTAEQYLADAQRETYGANFDAANEAARRLTGEPLIDYSAEVSQADIDSGYNPNTGKVEGLQVAGSEKVRRAVEAFEKGGEEGLKNILPILEGTANPAPTEPEPDTDAILRAQAKENLVRTPLAGTSEADIEAEFQRLKSNQLSPETESVLSGIGENLQNLPYAPQGVGRVIGGAIGGLGRLSDNLAGLERFSTSRLLQDYAVNPLLSLIGITPSDTSGTEKMFRQLGTGARIISTESSKGLGIAGELANMAGGALVDIPKLIGLSMLPGGAVVALGIDAGTQAAGRGDRLDTVGKEAAKGAVLGALFGAGSKLGKLVETGAQGALLATGKTAAADVLLATKILGEAAKIGTVFNGTFILEKATGARTDDAFKSAILNTIFDVVMQGQKIGQIKDLAGKAFRMNGNGKSADVTVDPNGEVKLLTEKLQPEFVDAEFDVSKVKDVELDENGVYRERGDTAAIETPNREVTAAVVEEAGAKRLTGEIAPEPEVGAVVEVSVKAENGRNIVKTGTVTELVQERGLKPSVRVEFEDGSQQIVPQRKTTVTEVKSDDSITLPSNKEVEQTSVKDEISAPETALQSNEIESRYKNLPTQKLQEVKVEKPVAKVITTTRPNIAEKLNVFTERGTKAAIEPKVIDSSEILTSLDEGYPQELQPRDRSRAASKAQISEIANKLNPEFLGDSPKASDGRPLVVPVELDGKTKYAVISGNGRTAGIREAYNLENEGSQKYAEFARSKSDTSAKQPVYVGILDAGEIKNLPEFAKEANESATAQMSATEQAKSDAERLDGDVLNLFVPSDDGTIHGAANRDFTRAFLQRAVPTSEQGRLVDAEGKLNQDGSIRVRNAIFARAFGDSESGLAAITRMSESTDNTVKNITNGLLAKAGSLAALREAAKTGTRHKEFDIAPDLARSMEKYASLKDTGTSVEEYIQQGNLFGAETTPFQTRVMQVFDAHKRSPKAIRSIISNFLDLAEEAGDPNQSNLFGEKTNLDIKSQFEAAVTTYERENSKSEQSDQSGLFGDQGIQLRQAADESRTSNTPNPDSENTGNRDGREAFAQKPGSQELGQPLYKKTSEQVGKETAKESENSTKIAEIEKERAREIQAAQKEAFRLPFISDEKGERLKLNRLVNVDFVTPSGRTLSKLMKAADRQNGLQQKENIFQKLLGSVNSQGDAATLKNGIKKLGKSINDVELEELEQSYDGFTEDGMSVYDASIRALADYHKDLFDSVNELRESVGLAKAEYTPFDAAPIHASFDQAIKKIGVTAPAPKIKTETRTSEEIDRPLYSKSNSVQTVDSPAFYSQLERVIEAKMPNRASAEQAKGIINNPQTGIKKEEIEWLGINEWLEGKDKVSKDEVLDFIRENQVEVKEVVKGAGTVDKDSRERTEDAKRELDAAKDKLNSLRVSLLTELESAKVPQTNRINWVNTLANQEFNTPQMTKAVEGILENLPDYDINNFHDVADELQRAEDNYVNTKAIQREESTKFSQYTLPGGENYKELLLTMPPKSVSNRFKIEPFGDHWAVTDTQTGRKSIEATRQDAEQSVQRDNVGDTKNAYRSSHFDEPNILAHIRFDERTDADGRKTLHIAEIQSDWLQALRKSGAKVTELPPEYQTGKDGNEWFVTKINEDGSGSIISRQSSEDSAIKSALDIINKNRVPDAPFKKSWQELGFKKALRYAVENNFDAVSWDTGEVQADRYSLAKQIDKLFYAKDENGKYSFQAQKDGKDLADKSGLSESELEDNIGKEVARKIIDNESPFDPSGKTHKGVLSGLDLKVGGEGMKGFYDKILPNFANKYVKKWGGKVDQTNTSIAKPQDGGWKQVRINPTEYRDFELIGVNRTSGEKGVISTFDTQREAENELKRYQQSDDIVPVHSIAITPEMRESVMQGQPLFNKPDTKEQAVQDKFGQAVDDVLDSKNTEASNLTDDLNLAIGQDVTVETLKNARISATGKMNEAAFALMTHANLKVFRNAAKEAWFGMFLNPQRTQKVRAALTELLGTASPGLARIYGARVLKQFDAATGENGGIKLIASSKNAPEGLEQAWQEESAHEADYFTGNRHQISEEIFPTDEIGQKAMSHLGENAYRNESESLLAIEVGAKIWRDDAETELNLSSEEIEHLRNLQIDALRAAGKTIEDIKTAFKDVSQSARKFTENYERENQSGQGNRTSGENFKPGGEGEIPRQIRGERERIGSGRSSDLLSASRLKRQETAQNRQNQDLDKYKKPENTELKRFKREENPARGPGNGSLVKHEIAIVERRFKKDPENLKRAKDEILYARASVPQTKTGAGLMKIGKFAVDIISAPKSFMSSFDISAAGRQGAVLSLSEPRIAARAFIQQIQSFRKVNYDNFVRDLNLHPFVEMAEASGLYLSTLSDQDALGKREEAFMSRLLGEEDYIKNKVGEKIRRIGTAHVRVSERAYLTYLDSLRINSFEKLAKQVNEYNLRKGLDKNEIIDAENNVTRIQDQMTALAEFVNYATGRGSLGVFENAAGVLNAGMFSPRYIMSRLQLLNPAFYAKLPPGVRKTALKKMLGFAGATAVIMGLLKLAGGEVELGDPEESDFLLKVKFGAFHYDFGAGFAQPIRYLARLIGAASSRFIEGKPLNAYGKVDKKGFGESKESSLTKQFARTKLSPTLGSAINLYTGTNMIGEKSTARSEAGNLLSPMIVNDVQKALEMEGVLGAAKMLPSLVGIGTGVYDKKKKKKEPEERAEREEKPEKPEK